MIILDKRLSTVASLVRKDAVFADIGTDHAYLPIYLIQSGICKKGYASDIRKGPLQSAATNISRYDCTSQITALLSDGLLAYSATDADDYIIAGMGGELIAKIIDSAPFEITDKYNFILQPMTREDELRDYLNKNGFSVTTETVVEDKTKSYVIMLATKTNCKPVQNPMHRYIGNLDFSLQSSRNYLERKIKSLIKQRDAQSLAGYRDKAEEADSVIKALEDILNENQ